MPIISCASQEALKYHRMKRDASQASLHADEPRLSGPRLSGPHDEINHQNLLFLRKIEQRKLLEDYRTKTHTGKMIFLYKLVTKVPFYMNSFKIPIRIAFEPKNKNVGLF